MGGSAPAAGDMESLRRLAESNGVATGFWDWYGRRRDVSADSLLAVLEALDVPVGRGSTVDEVRAALARAEDGEWRSTLPDCIVVRQGSAREIPVHVPHGDWVRVSYVLEDGSRGDLVQLDRWVPPREIDGHLVGRATMLVPDWLPLGWHRLVATVEGGSEHRAPLIVVPERLEPAALSDGLRHWGVSAQMYSVRSRGSWGIGDAVDLADLAALCADHGADFLLINPVHASSPALPMERSPYLPVTRRWVNPLYIRPEAVEEYAALPDDQRRRVEELRQAARGPEGSPLIDRDRVWGAKREALELLYRVPRSYHRESEFRAFAARGGPDLEGFALWCALVERAGEAGLSPDCARADAPGVGPARAEASDRIEFWMWCQWIVGLQMGDAQRVCTSLGMGIGIMGDLAVGVHRNGSETWAEPGMFARSMSVGAPPDMYSQQGQDWSQPPWSPRALARSGYRPLRDMVRAALAHAGAVRLDHILGLFRLWWIPRGTPAAQGTYVSYDHEAMVGVVLLEAQRAGAAVIGEDLGTVEPWVRGYLADRGILGTSVLWFEKEDSGWPLPADRYRRDVLATVTTHDLPPTAGYLDGVQTTLRDRLGLLVDDVETVRAADRVERERMLQRLREYGLIGADQAEPSTRQIVEALHRYIVRTPSRLVAASLVDAVGDTRPQNLPGTNREYPNWCVPLCDAQGREVALEDLPSDPRLTALFDIMGQVRA
ncbi:MAG: 4-alpha-glucanotransferase [Actinomyces sp.]|nr:4-alpha-glucanotransferase [Actinomyces sp.]MCI1662717.1 4-alpha-glucanotransferase [Actinomyces sp.]